MEKDQKIKKYTDIFLRIVKHYVLKYNEHAFELHFGQDNPIRIGESSKIITVRIKDPEAVFRRIFVEGSLGLGESYCEGKIEIADEYYKYFLFIFVRALYDKRIVFGLSFKDIFTLFIAGFLKGGLYSKETREENISLHYSLSEWFDSEDDSNTFYLYWLDSPYIQYTCGKWDADTKTVEEAQFNKLSFYAKRLGITEASKGQTLLDLGCGWGGLMFFMAEKFGLSCTGLTLSKAQARYIEKEAERRKINHLVKVIVKDIHDMDGSYDHITSVGLLCHIKEYDDLYKKVSRALKNDGSVLFHMICRQVFDQGLFYKPDPFILKYIFPGAATVNIKRNLRISRRYFSYVDRNDLPYLSYPKTLDAWLKKFCDNEVQIRQLLKDKSKVQDVDFAIRVFKHYLVLSSCGLSVNGWVSNILLKHPKK